MHAFPSSLTNQVQPFSRAREVLSGQGFSLGGNWDYDHGSFDCALDEANKVWLRLPFQVTVGSLDSEAFDDETHIQFGEPYALKHVYNEGSDHEAQPRGLGALVDQFQDPIDPDDEIESKWIDLAKQRLIQVESLFPR
jgi:hypothetical protein